MKRRTLVTLVLLGLVVFLVWRFIRPMNIFVVSDAFEQAIPTTDIPPQLSTLRAEECGACHQVFYKEWQTTIHSQAWTDPYFQTDWQFDGSQHVCRNCHTPLDRQQPHTVTGFRDRDKWDPIMAPNPDFDPGLQHEGVTCAACHLREGKIVGVQGTRDAPHPVQQLDDPNQVCVRCHVVEGDRWDTFFRFPPCGTVAEIQATSRNLPPGAAKTVKPGDSMPALPAAGKTGETAMPDTRSLGCVQCHMPLLERPLVAGGEVRPTRQHLWRGGHDPEMVKQGLDVLFSEVGEAGKAQREFTLTITNVGAAHFIPTGTPDRYLTVELRLLDRDGRVLEEQQHTIRRTVMWRPFIIDLRDTRLPRWQPRSYTLSVTENSRDKPAVAEAIVRYHLLNESRRRRIGYENREPVSYEVFRQKLSLGTG
jgi:hypothetical protein